MVFVIIVFPILNTELIQTKEKKIIFKMLLKKEKEDSTLILIMNIFVYRIIVNKNLKQDKKLLILCSSYAINAFINKKKIRNKNKIRKKE